MLEVFKLERYFLNLLGESQHVLSGSCLGSFSSVIMRKTPSQSQVGAAIRENKMLTLSSSSESKSGNGTV